MGGRWGALWRAVSFRLDPQRSATDGTTGVLTTRTGDGNATSCRAACLEYIEAELKKHVCINGDAAAAALPFDFWGDHILPYNLL
jgi:hypothetical protein